ncbi:MAG: hypothetical protein ACTSXD_08420 [Candidatus Heimdallarchaeaceae archaeon]
MCKGLAICVNKDKEIICEGISSHTETLNKNNIPLIEHDNYLLYEVILPHWNKPIWDSRGNDQICLNIWDKLGLLDDNLKPKKGIKKAVKKWLIDNELKVKTYFLENQGLFSYQTVNGNMNCSEQKIEGDMDCLYQEVKGNMGCSHQKVEGDMYCSYQEVKGNMGCSFQKVKGNMGCSNQKVKGNMYCSFQKVDGYMDCSFQYIKGDINCLEQIVDGNMYCSGQKVNGDIYIKHMRNGSKETQKLLDKFSNDETIEKYTFDNFVKWLVNKNV